MDLLCGPSVPDRRRSAGGNRSPDSAGGFRGIRRGCAGGKSGPPGAPAPMGPGSPGAEQRKPRAGKPEGGRPGPGRHPGRRFSPSVRMPSARKSGFRRAGLPEAGCVLLPGSGRDAGLPQLHDTPDPAALQEEKRAGKGGCCLETTAPGSRLAISGPGYYSKIRRSGRAPGRTGGRRSIRPAGGCALTGKKRSFPGRAAQRPAAGRRGDRRTGRRLCSVLAGGMMG